MSLEGDGLAAAVDLDGAQLRSFMDIDGQQLLWQGDPRFWSDQALLLFPIIGPVEGGHIHQNGRSYPMPDHGFARTRRFTLAEHSSRHCSLELRDDEETRQHYPFSFLLLVSFELAGGTLEQAVSVHNTGDEVLFADVGFHPGFNWPLDPSRGKDEYSIVFSQPEPAPVRRGEGDPVRLYVEGRPTPVEGRVLRLRDELFEDLAIVWDRLNSRSLTYGAPGSRGLRIDFPDSPHLGLWMIPGATYVCVEPWQGYPSPMNFRGPLSEKPGIGQVAPGTTRRWRLKVTPVPAIGGTA